jgi:hypothetical protein
MGGLRAYRTGWNLNGSQSTEFYFKVENDGGRVIGTFLVDEDGLYYYKPKSSILTPSESGGTQNTYDGYISFRDLSKIMNGLNADDDKKLKIRCKKSQVLIQISESD